MRIKTKMNFKQKQALPFNHQFYLMSAVLNKIGETNSELAYKYHEKPKYKPYNLSWINLNVKDTNKKGLIPDNKKAHFYFSSPHDELINAFVEGFLNNPTLTINHNDKNIEFELNTIESLDKPKFKDTMKFQTITPIAVRTIRQKNGKKKTIDLFPNSKKFYENLFNNLYNRYEDFHEKKPNIKKEDVDMKVLNWTKKRLKIRDTYQMSSQTKFKIYGSKDLNQFMYQTGLGERNNQAFGCLRIN